MNLVLLRCHGNDQTERKLKQQNFILFHFSLSMFGLTPEKADVFTNFEAFSLYLLFEVFFFRVMKKCLI